MELLKGPSSRAVSSGIQPDINKAAEVTCGVAGVKSVNNDLRLKNRILIVDDYAPFRSALREFLSQEPDMHVVGEAGSLAEAIAAVRILSPQLVLTDLTMPDTRGIGAVTGLRQHCPDVRVLVLSLHHANEYRVSCRTAGAAGYVAKDAIHEKLCDVIRTVLAGGNDLRAAAWVALHARARAS